MEKQKALELIKQVIAQAIAGISTFLLGGAAADSKKDN